MASSLLDPQKGIVAWRLAVSEISLAIRSLVLRNERLELKTGGGFVLYIKGKRERHVPAMYIPARVVQEAAAQQIDLSLEDASKIWCSLIELGFPQHFLLTLGRRRMI